jgi:hypothetical protein
VTGVLRPIESGWVVTGGPVPGPDVDEFAEPHQVIAALAEPGVAGTDTLLAVQHPNHTPAALAAGLSVAQTLPAARAMLDRVLSTAYRRVSRIVAPYLVSGHDGTALGLLCLADPAAVDSAGHTRVRRAERVYPDVVADRAAVLQGLGVATSAAMLVPVTGTDELTPLLRRVIGVSPTAVATIDSAGRRHQLWLVEPGSDQDELIAAASRHPLLVADGNHRVAAAATGESGLLALVTAGPDLRVGAIHRVLVGTGLGADDLSRAWGALGIDVSETAEVEPRPGTVVALAGGRSLLVTLPPPAVDEPLPRIDHGVVERLLIKKALGIDPAGPRVRALPEDTRPPDNADAVLLIAPVPYDDVLAVHEQGRRMPRKATYFTPKPRSGLLLAALG